VVDSLIYVADEFSLEILRLSRSVGVSEERVSALQIRASKPRLLQNRPNPFSTETLIRYEIPIMSSVRLDVYDTSGRLVERLVKKAQGPGIHEANWNAKDLPAGIYFCRLDVGDETDTRKMTLLK
jgi:hypothetical protein